MRTIHNYVQAEKARREENGDEGFSLIELIVVVVILGILAAVAIPVFLGLQEQAEDNAREAVAANAATQYAAWLGNTATPKPENSFATLEGDKYSISVTPATGATLDTFCITASEGGTTTEEGTTGGKSATSGPGCSSS